MSPLLRSLLFAPGDDLRKVAKARTLGADAVVLDLEDAVAEAEKDTALARVAPPPGPGGVRGGSGDEAGGPRGGFGDEAGGGARGGAGGLLVVRVNAPGSGRMERELARLVSPALDAVLIPKVQSPQELVRVDGMLRALEAAADVPLGSTGLLALVETARGIAFVEEVACVSLDRTLRLVFGSADFTTDAGLGPRAGDQALLYARSRVVVASAAAGLPAPLDGPWLGLGDLDGLRADCERSVGLGFGGRVTIHPEQLVPVHEVYGGVGPEEIAQAERVVAAFEDARADGRAAIRVGGEFVDEPIYRRALSLVRGGA